MLSKKTQRVQLYATIKSEWLCLQKWKGGWRGQEKDARNEAVTIWRCGCFQETHATFKSEEHCRNEGVTI